MKSFGVLFALISTFTPVPRSAALPDAEWLLEQAERIRSPQSDYVDRITLVDERKGKRDQHSYEGLIKGQHRAIVKFLAPEADRGTKLLFVDNNMWIYIPTTAKPIRVAPRQKLMGNATYGDIVRLNFVGNYRARFLRTEKFHNRDVQVIQLSAIEGRTVSYDEVEYWIDTATHSPLKAIYLTAAGKAIRECYFDHFESVMGVKRPTRFVLVDHLEHDHVTTLTFSQTRKKSLPELLFEKENFARE